MVTTQRIKLLKIFKAHEPLIIFGFAAKAYSGLESCQTVKHDGVSSKRSQMFRLPLAAVVRILGLECEDRVIGNS